MPPLQPARAKRQAPRKTLAPVVSFDPARSDAKGAGQAQALRLEAMGLLARKAAHDLNNLLTIVFSASSLVRGHLEPNKPGLTEIDLVLAAGHEAADLIRSLQEFDGPDDEPEAIDLDEMLRAIHDRLKGTLGRKFALVLDLNASGTLILASRTRVEALLAMLTLEARLTLPPRSRLALRTEYVPPAPGAAKGRVLLTVGSPSGGPGVTAHWPVQD